MARLSTRLDDLHALLPNGTRVVYIDVPLHFNVGDLLINAGTERFFERSMITPVVRLTIFDICDIDQGTKGCIRLKTLFLDAMKNIPSNIPILLHGGGNIGDLYPEFQAMREAIIESFPSRRIIILPQSIHFDNELRQSLAIERMLRHADLHIFVRDRPSLDAIRAVAKDRGALLPDMAHALWSELTEYRSQEPSKSCLTMRRRDDETRLSIQGSRTFDWDDIVSSRDIWLSRLIRKSMYLGVDRTHRLPLWLWYRLRDRIIARAFHYFAAYGTIDTDRLHGLILGCLMARHVNFVDNRYGKLSRYVSEWLSCSPLVLPSL
jgi:pyruvyl transferase EpsO